MVGVSLDERDLPRSRPRGRNDDGNLVLCHPDRGIICLEVKGGGLECQHGTFYRLPAGGGKRERMPDPFSRPLDHRFALQRKIAEG